MRLEVYRKIVSVESLASLGDTHRAAGRCVVHCHGCFDVVHPGHVRYLEHAGRRGDVLVVSLTGDDAIEKSDGTRPYIPERYRAENLAALAFVDHVVVAPGATAEPIIRELQPDLYVKGKEYEESTHPGFLAEKTLVESYGGRVMFSSGEVVFSSSAIIESLSERAAAGFAPDARLAANVERWGLEPAAMARRVSSGFEGLRVAVVGDSIRDRYIDCEAGDVASEAPILSVRPRHETSYLGGAAVIAGHLRCLGARPHLVTCLGNDAASEDLRATLAELDVAVSGVAGRADVPSKQRYLVDEQKLLKVDRGEPAPLDGAGQRELIEAVLGLGDLDAAIFTDFGYGVITTAMLDALVPSLRPRVGVLAGDVSGPRRSLLHMNGFDLLTPTERELRGVMGDFEGSLPAVAGAAMGRLSVPHALVTLGAKGAVLLHPRHRERERWFEGRLRSDYLPALAERRVDVVGAGDAMLATATLAAAAGASPPEWAYLGALASSIAIGRMGNVPVRREELLAAMRSRPELRSAAALPAAG